MEATEAVEVEVVAAMEVTDLNTKTETKEATLKPLKEVKEVVATKEVATEESPEDTKIKKEDLILAMEVAAATAEVVAAMVEVVVATASAISHPSPWFLFLQIQKKPNPKKWSLSPTSSRCILVRMLHKSTSMLLDSSKKQSAMLLHPLHLSLRRLLTERRERSRL